MLYLRYILNCISIHAAREGGDHVRVQRFARTRKFQSTPPVKAATKQLHTRLRQLRFQSTPPMKAATDFKFTGDVKFEFQSTPPVKAATHRRGLHFSHRRISIHAAREGGDMPARYAPVSSSGFQSTPPVKAATALERG